MTLKLVVDRIDKARARVEAAKDFFECEGPTTSPPIAPADLAAIEQKLGVELPRALRDFYTKRGASYRWGWRASFGSGLLALVDAHDLERHVLAREDGRVTLLRITTDSEGGGYALDLRERGFKERIAFCDATGGVRKVSPTFANFMAVWAEQAFAREREAEGAKIVEAVVRSGKLPSKLPPGRPKGAPAIVPPRPPPDLDPSATKLLGDRRGWTELPAPVCEMRALTELYLEGNRILALPSAFSGLVALETLNLSDNPLGSAATLSLLGRLPKLRWLMMWNCFTGALPPSIGELRAIEFLSLAHNDLAALPPELGNLSTLTELSLSHNSIVRLPDRIADLKELKWLFVDHNPTDLDGLFAQTSTLPKLERLSFSADKDVPDSIGGLRQLTHVFVNAGKSGALGRKLAKLLPDAKVIFQPDA
jgi:hypothetical protein